MFFYILQLPHTVFLHSEKLTHPNVQWSEITFFMNLQVQTGRYGNILFKKHGLIRDLFDPNKLTWCPLKIANPK